jgi:hypothetical protein
MIFEFKNQLNQINHLQSVVKTFAFWDWGVILKF